MKKEANKPLPSSLNEEEVDLLSFIRIALAEPSPDAAKEAGIALKPVLSEVCSAGLADRAKIWAALSVDEQARFKSLLG